MKLMKKIVALLCVAMMLFSMSGCRDTSVIEKIIYDYLLAHETDMEKDTLDDQEENELDDDLPDIEKDDESEKENEKEKTDPVYEPEVEPSQINSAGTPNYRDNTGQHGSAPVAPIPDNSGTIHGAAAGDDVTPSDESAVPPDNAQNPTTEIETGDVPAAPDDAAPEEEEEENQPSNPDEGSDPDQDGEQGNTGGHTTRLVVDDYGNEYEVPENVDTVAAVDSAALAVLMLGGVERLAAADADLTSDSLATTVFAGLSSVPALWSASGTVTPLSDSALQQLIDIHPDVCFETSGSATFTNEQVETLVENGIYFVALPAPSSTANLKMIAQIVGGVLGDHTSDGGYDSVSVANSYRSWVDSTVTSVSRAGGSSVYTLYVDGWDPEAYYSFRSASDFFGYGVAYINNKRMASCVAVSNFLGYASVTNVTKNGDFVRAETNYFTPFNTNYSSIEVTGTAAASLTKLPLLKNGGSLGASNFKTVVAGSRSVKAGLDGSPLWQAFGFLQMDNGLNGYGFLDDVNSLQQTTISDTYEVIVNPRGIGDWASGSVESILETVWASYALAGGYSEDEMRDTISEFYSTFYHYALSEQQIDGILAGES